MKYITLVCCLLTQLFSAQVTIKGLLQSHDGQPVARANVILMDKNNNIDSYTFSQSNGEFSLVTEHYGDFVVEINAMGFVSKKEKVSFIKKGITVDLKTIVLEKIRTEDIKEVVISRTNPIKIKKDTVEYKADKFTNGTEQNVEDLLKKLPGITVQKDGKIKVNNKEVERVMVEGDDLFEKGYQTLTQNMPTKPVETVQILKNYSKNKLLKNVEKSESVAINLTLKEKEKGKWFGNVILASTSYAEDMRQGKFNLMNFTKRKKVYLLYNANNLGLNEMDGVGYLINPDSNQAVENVGSDISTLSMLNLHRKNYSFGDNRTNFNNDQLASLSYIYNFKKDWKLKLVSIYNTTENRNYTDSYYQFDYDGTSFRNTESKTWKQNNKNIVGKIELTKDYKKSNLVFYSKFSSLNEDNDNHFIFNGVPNFQSGNNKLSATENRVVFTKKIDSSAAIVAVARYIHQNRPYEFFEKNNLAAIISGDNSAQLLHQKVDAGLDFGGAKFSWLKNYSENRNLQINAGLDFRKHRLQSDLSLLGNSGQAIYFDQSAFFNDLEFSKNTLFSQLDYKVKWKKNWNFSTTILNEYMWTELDSTKKYAFAFSPSFNLGYGTFSFGTISINAGKRYTTTAVDNLYSGYIYQGERSFKNNLMGFSPIASYNGGINYNRGDGLTRVFNININYTKNEDYLSSQSIINPNYSFYQSILLKNNESWNANLELKRYLKPLKSRISLLGNFMKSNYQSSINNQPLFSTQFTNLKAGLEMKSGFLGKFNYEWGYTWTFNFVNSDNGKNKYTDQNGFANFYYNLSRTLKSELKYEYYKSGNSAQIATQFLDFKLNYQATQWKMVFFLAANNLLNTKEIRSYSITNVSESAYTQRLLPLHIVIGLNKNF